MSLLLSHCRCRISIDDSVLSNELILSIYQYQSGEAIDHVNMLSFNQVMGPNGQSTTKVVHSLDLMIRSSTHPTPCGRIAPVRNPGVRGTYCAESSTSLKFPELFPVDSANSKLARTSVDVILCSSRLIPHLLAA